MYGATLTTDRFGHERRAYSFPDNPNYIDIGDTGDGVSALSISLWMRPAIKGGYRSLVTKYDGSDVLRKSFAAQIIPSGELQLVVYTPAETDWHEFTTSAFDYALDTWYHVALVYASPNALVYIDGNVWGFSETDGFGAYGEIRDTDTPCEIGDTYDALLAAPTPDHTNFYHGDLDDIRIYTRALSQDEIVALYQEGDPG